MSVWSVVWDSIPGRSTCNPKTDLRGPCRLTGHIHCSHSWLMLASMLLQGSLCPALKRCILRPGSVAIIPHYWHICCTHSNQKTCISPYIECRQPCTRIKLVMWSIYVCTVYVSEWLRLVQSVHCEAPSMLSACTCGIPPTPVLEQCHLAFCTLRSCETHLLVLFTIVSLRNNIWENKLWIESTP